MSIVLLVLGLVLFLGLVVIHEFGHFIFARRNGVEVEEFGIGFPPKAWGRRIKSKKGDYNFTLNWLPLGGFVKLKGEHDADTAEGSFGAASLPAKVKIMVAGVGMNLGIALLLFTLVALLGMPQFLKNQFTVASDTKVVRQEVLAGYVEPDSPAQKAGVEARDRIISIGAAGEKQSVESADSFPELTKQYAGKEAEITYQRDSNQITRSVQLRSEQEVEDSKKTDEPKGYLGIAPTEYTIQRSTWSAPIVAAGLTGQLTRDTLKGLGNALTNLFRGDTSKASEQVSGPVGIFVVLRDGSVLGYQFILFVVAVISLTLAIMNVLPIPALDGGRLFLTLFYRAIKRPLTERTEDLVHGTGFAVLMVLFLLITVVDVKRFF